MTKASTSSLQRLSNLLIVAIVAVAAVVIWSLVEQNRILKDQLSGTSQIDSSLEFFETGDTLPNVTIATTTGATAELLSRIDGGGVVAFLTTTCPFCARSLGEWEKIQDDLKQAHLPLIGISLHPAEMTREYVEQHNIAFPVVTVPSLEDQDRLKVGAVPFTVAVDDSGTVTKAWRGLLTPSATDEIIAFLAQDEATSLSSTRRGAVAPSRR